MDVKDLFDSPEFSDITIKLGSGYLLRAHKIVLSRGSMVFKSLLQSRMSEAEKGVITFPDHDDETIRSVIAYLYGCPIAISKLTPEVWVNFLRFAHYIEISKLVELACSNPPSELMPAQLISLGDELDLPVLMGKGFQLFFREMETYHSEFVDEICCLSWDVYMRMHEQWLAQKFDPWVLFELDCTYCWNISTENDGIALLTKFLVHIDISSFTYTQLVDCLQFPFISDSPLLVHLFTHMAKLKPIEGYSKMPSRQEGLILHGIPMEKRSAVVGNTMVNFASFPRKPVSTVQSQRQRWENVRQDMFGIDTNGSGATIGLEHGRGIIAARDPRRNIVQPRLEQDHNENELADILANI